MKTVTINCSTVNTLLAPGIVPGKLRFSIVELSLVQDVDGVSATFEDIEPGKYTAQVVRLNADGSFIGEAKEADFEVLADVYSELPNEITVTVA